MNWQEILVILGPLVGIMAWGYGRIEKHLDRMDHELKDMRMEIKDARKDIQSLDSRVARIEGQLIGPPRWEPHILEKKEE